MLAKINKDIVEIVIPRVKAKLKPELQALFNDAITYHINPTRISRLSNRREPVAI
jgi:S-adenosylmethionine synthetase